MELVEHWPGVWERGENAGRRGTAIAFRASNLCTQANSDPSEVLFGPPSEFRLDDGRSGDALLANLMPFPRVDDFRYGCVREAILAAHWQATSGMWLGNANFSQGLYCVDNQEGETGLVAMTEDTCHGVLHSGDPFREYDLQSHLARVPDAVRPQLQELAEELERQWNGYCSPTCIFWAEGDRLAGTEEFPVLYAYGFETLQHEILDDDRWLETVVEEEVDADAARAIIQVARRYVEAGTAVIPTPDELALIFPPDAPGRADGIQGISDEEYIAIIETGDQSDRS